MTKIRIAINGFGRIGRNILRALHEGKQTDTFELVAINDMGTNLAVTSNLIKYDSVHGKFAEKIEIVNNANNKGILINGQLLHFFASTDPATLPWQELDIDVVLECTGKFTSFRAASKHIEAGAKKVIISAPGDEAIDATVVYGVNHHILTPQMQVISNASCTTNCLAPIVQIINDTYGIDKGFMTTVHALTNDQELTDTYHNDPYRARAATLSMIPTKTGATKALGLVLPELAGMMDGISVRVPLANVSMLDVTLITKTPATKEAINEVFKEASLSTRYKKILAYNEETLVSMDFNHSSYSAIFDALHTRAQQNLVKICVWYDNEWGFSNRMLDIARYFFTLKKEI